MRTFGILSIMLVAGLLPTPVLAAEGSALAGPIGGTDIRTAQLPPPGMYGGAVAVYSNIRRFYDGEGNLVPPLEELDATLYAVQPFFLYVPDAQLFGGSIGVVGILQVSSTCGRVFETIPEGCSASIGDAYVEADWSRFFGTVRPSQDPGAFPIAEGLTVAAGFGVLVPTGEYDAETVAIQGPMPGNNIWDFAPSVAITYMTKPLLAEGTEFSAKVYWNNYLTNPATDYSTGSLINADFAISERLGRVQAGMAGAFAFQVEDDKLSGQAVAADGRRVEVLLLGGVLVYDMPEYGSSFKLKALTSVITHNAPSSFGIILGWVKKF